MIRMDDDGYKYLLDMEMTGDNTLMWKLKVVN